MSDLAKFRKQRERAAMDGQVARMIADGNTAAFPKDRFGKPIAPGSTLLFRPTFDFVYSVVAVDPVLDPGVPGGHVRVTMRSETSLMVPLGQPIMSAVVLAPPEPSPQGDGDPGDVEAPAEPEPESAPSGLWSRSLWFCLSCWRKFHAKINGVPV